MIMSHRNSAIGIVRAHPISIDFIAECSLERTLVAGASSAIFLGVVRVGAPRQCPRVSSNKQYSSIRTMHAARRAADDLPTLFAVQLLPRSGTVQCTVALLFTRFPASIVGGYIS